MRDVIQKRYQSSEHLDYPEMERLIDQVIEHPERKFSIPNKFLIKKHNNSDFLQILIHKITVFIRSIWLNLKKTVNQDYHKRFKLAVKKIIKAYEEANRVKKVAEETVPSTGPAPEDSKDERETARQREVESSVKTQIDEQPKDSDEVVITTTEDDKDLVTHEGQTDANDEIEPPAESSDTSTDKNNRVISETLAPPTPIQHKTVPDRTSQAQKEEIVEAKPKTLTNYEVMCEAIKRITHSENLQNLWKALFGNVTNIDARIKNWNCVGNQFTIKLNRPLHLWINTERVGGCIFSFGNNDSCTITGSLKRNEIEFDTGFTSYCVHNIWLAYKRVEPTMHNIKYVNRNKVEVTGSYWKMSNTHEDTYANMLKEWSNNVSVVPDGYSGGYKEYLENKFAEQK